ncbi:MAG: hypothetical protein JWM05_2392 [Acidimicrobiales bacterium]|nr:hypothetical protein [Acidimicrobiales bacterium]
MVLVSMTLLLTSCVMHQRAQIEVDFMGPKYRFYVYQRPSFLAIQTRHGCTAHNHTRESIGKCVLRTFRDVVRVPMLAHVNWSGFAKDSNWPDVMDALDDVAAGGYVGKHGDEVTRRCLAGQHNAFGSYNWTWRSGANGHCKRGRNPS